MRVDDDSRTTENRHTEQANLVVCDFIDPMRCQTMRHSERERKTRGETVRVSSEHCPFARNEIYT